MILGGITALYYVGVKSQNMQNVVNLSEGLPPCPDKPNCVSSMATKEDQKVNPFIAPNYAIQNFKTVIESMHGTVVSSDENSIHATFKSGTFGFVDDLYIVRASPDQFEVMSQSRVGHSDMGANGKRVERLRGLIENQKVEEKEEVEPEAESESEESLE